MTTSPVSPVLSRQSLAKCLAILGVAFAVSASAASAQECNDGSDINYVTLNTGYTNLIAGSGTAQSFTASCDGRVRTIEVSVVPDTFEPSLYSFPVVGTVRVLLGDGSGGSEIVTAPYSIPAAGQYIVDFLQYFPIAAGQTYTVAFDAPTSGGGGLFGSDTENPYAGGERYVGPATSLVANGGDLAFALDIASNNCSPGDALAQTRKDGSVILVNIPPSVQADGQYFTATCTGILNAIQVDIAAAASPPASGTLRIFAGNGSAGRELASQPYTFTTTGVQNTVLSRYIPIKAGSVYTFLFDVPTGGSVNLWAGVNESYPGHNIIAGPDAATLGGVGGDLTMVLDFQPGEISYPEAAALVDLYFETDGDNWKDNTGWLTDTPSNWFGVGVSSSQVVNLYLFDNNLIGTLPSSIGDLVNMNVVELGFNYFTGPIPPEIGNLTALSSLGLRGHGDGFTGSIPSTIANLTNLAVLQLASNSLSGNIPDLSPLTGLNILSLDDNELQGPAPDLTGLSLLGEINLSINQLSGIIPTGTLSSGNLTYFDVSSNNFSGALPPIASTALTGLVLSNNDFTALPDLSAQTLLNNLRVPGNRLEYDDLEPSAFIPNGVLMPQQPFGNLQKSVFSEGQNLTLSQPVGGSANSYQWQKNGAPIPLATQPNLSIANATDSDAGTYRLLATSSIVGGTLQSEPILIVRDGNCRSSSDFKQPDSSNTRILNGTQGLGQTFFAPCDGLLHGISVFATGTATGTLTVYEDIEGSLSSLGDTPYAFSGTGFQNTVLSTPIRVFAGVTYTFLFHPTASGSGDLRASTGDAYAGGLLSTGPDSGSLTEDPDGADLAMVLDFEPEPAHYVVPDGYVFTEYANSLSGPQGIAFDAAGNTLVTSTLAGEIFRYAPDGTPVDGGLPLLSGIGRPIDLEVRGNLLFISSLDDDAIYRVDLTTLVAGSDISTVQPTPWLAGLNGPTYMTSGPLGNLYFSEVKVSATDKIRRVNPNSATPTPTTVVEFPVDPAFPLGINPQGLAFDRNGDLFFATGFGNDVRRIKNPAAATLPINVANVTPVFTGLDSPAGVDIGIDGKLYVSDRNAVYSATIGSAVMTPFVSGLGGYDFNNAEFDPEGRLFIADGNTGQVVLTVAPKRQIQASGSITYMLNAEGNPRITDGSDLQAIRNAFGHWQNVTTATITAVDGGTTTVEKASAVDGINLVTFKDNDFPFAPFVLAVAAKLIDYSSPDEAVILDADIVFNPAFVNDPKYKYGTDNFPGYFDIESIATHEAGHTLGMIHSGNPAATMFFALPDGKKARTLELDDRAWISQRYPDATFSTLGGISGTVIDGEAAGVPVAGALVLARNMATQDLVHAYTDLSGEYLVPGLTPGDYRVSIQPLDGSVFGYPLKPGAISVNLATIARNLAFQEEYYNGANESGDPVLDVPSDAVLVAVTASAATANINLETNRDLTPPSVLGFFPDDGSVDASVNTDILITFSEPIDGTTLSVTVRHADTGAAVAGSIQLENEATLAVIGLQEALATSTSYEVAVAAGLSDDRGNVSTSTFAATFTTQPPDTSVPTVKSILPANGATGVNTRDAITVGFSEPMAPASLSAAGNFVVTGGASTVQGVVTVDRNLNNTVATFKPNAPLIEATSYTVTLGTGVTDASGNGLAAPFVSTFQTIPAAPPEVIAVGPANGQQTVGVQTPIVLDFSEAIDRTSVTASSVVLTGPHGAVPGSFAFLLSDSRVVFYPTGTLDFGATYTVNVSTSVKDLSNPQQTLTTTFASTFATAAAPTSPAIVSASPPSALAGTVVVIAGSGFSPVPAANVVSFNGVLATVSAASLSALTLTVPTGATSGPLTVTTGGLTSNAFSFAVVNSVTSPDEAARIAAEGGSRDTDVSPDGTFAYVTNSDAGTVSVINLVTLTAETPITVGDVPYKIAINPEGTRAYVTNFGSHTVSVIDLQTNTVVATIPVGLNPTGVAVSPDGSKIYVAEYTSKGVSIIQGDPARGGYNAVVARVSTESGNRDVQTSPDGTRAFVTGTAGLAVIDLDPASSTFNQVTARVSRESETRDVAVSPDGTSAFVTLLDGGILWIDIRTNAADPYQVVARTSRESGGTGVEASPDGTGIFVTNFNAGTVDVYNLEIGLGGNSSTVVASAGREFSPTISTGFNLRLVDSVPVGTNPDGIVFDPTTSKLIVANTGSGDVSVLDFGIDTDGDGLSDAEELELGTDPNNPDTDGDGVIDSLDEFPLDPNESGDNDHDGLGNNVDPDDDNDGLLDVDETRLGTNPFDPDTDDDEVQDGLEVACSTDPLLYIDFPTGTVGGTVTGNGVGLVGVLVKLLDGRDPSIVLAETWTTAGGAYSFGSRKTIPYSLVAIEPTGFRPASGVDNPADLVTDCSLNVVDFPLDAFVLVNNAKPLSYWKHQFDRIARNKTADESASDLLLWIASVKDRYTDRYYQTLFTEAVDGEGNDLAEWHLLLSASVPPAPGGGGIDKTQAKAEAEIAALVLNVMSLKIGQTEIISADGHDVGDVITYASQIVIDPETAAPHLQEKKAYLLAEEIAKFVNNQQLIAAGRLPACTAIDCERLYKGANEEIPADYSLDQNYPNPFAHQTTIRFGIPQAGPVRIDVYDLLGQRVLTVTDGEQAAGFHEVSVVESGLASGLYLYRMIAGDFVQVRKMLFRK